MIRQGDILLVPAVIPEGATPVPRGARGVVLAEGESTGHAHVMTGEGTELLEWTLPGGAARGLRVPEPDTLVHEEHGRDAVPAGDYIVIRQVEHTPEGLRQVAD